MKEPDLEAGLSGLRKSISHIKALLAWVQLKESEAKPGQPPSFTLTDTTRADLRNEYSFFLFTAVQMHHILNSDNACFFRDRSQRIRAELAKLENQVNRLNLPERFYQ